MTTSLKFHLNPPNGHHPTQLTHLSIQSNSLLQCTLHLHISLPPEIFVDPYELANYAEFYAFTHAGTRNLELPVVGLPEEEEGGGESEVLLDVHPGFGRDVEVRVPLHARYPRVSDDASSAFYNATIPWPKAFFICPSTATDPISAAQPFPNMSPHLLSSLKSKHFSTHSIVVVVNPIQENASDTLRIPVGSSHHTVLVESGTAITVLSLFAYLLWVSLRKAKQIQEEAWKGKEE